MIFQKSFPSDGTSNRQLMIHQIKNSLCFSVPILHCLKWAIDAASRGTPKSKHGSPRDELKNGRGRESGGFYEIVEAPIFELI